MFVISNQDIEGFYGIDSQLPMLFMHLDLGLDLGGSKIFLASS